MWWSRKARVLSGIKLSIKEAPVPNDPLLPFWQQPAFIITCMLMIPIYFVTAVVLWPGSTYAETTKTMVITAALLSSLAAILGFWLAGSHGSKPNPDQDKPPMVKAIQGEKK